MATLQRAYLIVGTDELKRQTAVRRLKAGLNQDFLAFNLEEVGGARAEAGALTASLDTLPVGDEMRLVIVSGAEHLKGDVSDAIVSYLGNPNPAAVLVLVAERLARSTRLYKAVAAAGERTVVDCSPKRRWELPAHVARLASAHGVTMDLDAAQELVARVGESTTLLDAHLATLAELCAATGRVGVADVRAHVARTAEVRPWELLDAVSARDAGGALELYALMRNPSQVALVAMLAGRVRELICARCLAARGQASLLASELGKQAWQVKSHHRWAGAFAPGELEGLLDRCARCDAAIKGGANADVAFSELVLLACGVGQGDPPRRAPA